MGTSGIKAVLFDFGGVIADEGFRNGLYEIARSNGLAQEEFFEKARDLIHETGYLTGQATQEDYWDAVRRETGIEGSDEDLTRTIFKGFIVRPWMMDVIMRLKENGIRVAILSDQTNWLDELEEHMKIFGLFEHVFNSFHIGKSKIDKSLFGDVLSIMRLSPEEALFVDDTPGHVDRAREMGLKAIHFRSKDDFMKQLAPFFPGLF